MVASHDSAHHGSIVDTSYSTTTYSLSDPFPRLSPTEYVTIERVAIAASHARDHKTLEDARKALNLPEQEDDVIFSILLRLGSEKGLNWGQKWESAKASLEERGYVYATTLSTKGHRKNVSGQGARRQGTSVLQAKVEQITPETVRWRSRAPSTPGRLEDFHPRGSSNTTRRHHDLVPKPVPTPRPFLKIRGDGGHSSSDDFVGVPSVPRHRSLSPATPKVVDPSNTRPIQTSALSTRLQGKSLPNTVLDQPTDTSSPSHPLMSNRIHHRSSSALPILSDRFTAAQSSAAARNRQATGNDSEDNEDPALTIAATRFNHIRLVIPLFMLWREKRSWLEERARGVDKARAVSSGLWAMNKWKQRLASAQDSVVVLQVCEKEWHVKHERQLRNRLLMIWRRRTIQKKRAAEEKRLRGPWSLVVNKRKERLVGNVVKSWYLKAVDRRLNRFYRTGAVVNQKFRTWYRRLERIRTMQDVAEDTLTARDRSLAFSSLQFWRKRLRLAHAESSLQVAVIDKTLHTTLFIWRNRLDEQRYERDLSSIADEFWARKRGEQALAIWRDVLDRRIENENRAQQHRDLQLLDRVFTMWLIELAGRKVAAGRLRKLGHTAIVRWYTHARYVCVELEVKVDQVRARSGKLLKAGAWQQWRAAISVRKRSTELAERAHVNLLAKRAIAQWSKRHLDVIVLEERAHLAGIYLLQRTAWNLWRDEFEHVQRLRSAEERQRAVVERKALLQQCLNKYKQATLQGWRALTRRAQDDRVKIEMIATTSDRRLLRRCLAVHIERVVNFRAAEVDAAIEYDQRSKRDALSCWIKRLAKFSALHDLATSYLESTKKKQLRVVLKTWSQRATMSDLANIMIDTRQSSMCREAFDRWREKSLESRADPLFYSQNDRILKEAWITWTDRAKAMHFVSARLLRMRSQVLTIWRDKTPDPRLIAFAIERYRLETLHRRFGTWRIKAIARKSLRSLQRRSLGTSSLHSAYASFTSILSSPLSSPGSYGLVARVLQTPDMTPSRQRPLNDVSRIEDTFEYSPPSLPTMLSASPRRPKIIHARSYANITVTPELASVASGDISSGPSSVSERLRAAATLGMRSHMSST